MTKKKLQRFADMETFSNVIQPSISEILGKDFYLKGIWNRNYFFNNYPVVLELGCGKGEYTVELARQFPLRNFVGVDIKGSRMWKGAKTALDDKISNVAFLRTRIELITSLFGNEEVYEIWITFPDPQVKKRRKRLTSAGFLNSYSRLLKNNGLVHLKTDSQLLYEYTLNLIRYNRLNIKFNTSNLYNSGLNDEILSIRTFYERQFLEQGLNIHYLCFELPHEKAIEEPAERF
jgi:tRNA (guanine-N7-)-methyltransferase